MQAHPPWKSGFERMPGKTSRPAILLTVLLLHLATLALLVAGSKTLKIAGFVQNAVQLMVIPPVRPPKLRIESPRPQRLSTNIAVALEAPVLNSSSQSAAGSAPDGQGAAVNWEAEAHRAVRAFEIRTHQTKNSALSVSSSLDVLGSREHHAGDQMKTANGDWIVWINANCYQIASWHSNAPDVGAMSARTICRNSAADGSGAAH